MLSKNMYENELIQIGLTNKQAKCYLSALELGKATAADIAKRADIKRSTVYGILDELIAKGLVSYSQKGKKKFFKGSDPSVIIEIANANKRSFETILPDLSSIYSKHKLKPSVQFFEGREGIKRIYEDTLTCKYKKIYQVVKVNDFIKFPGAEFSKEYIQKRAAKGITAYAIHPQNNDLHNDVYGENSSALKRQVKYIDEDIFHTSMTMIYDYKVAVISTESEGFGFIIESKEFSQMMQGYFDFMWKMGQKDIK